MNTAYDYNEFTTPIYYIGGDMMIPMFNKRPATPDSYSYTGYSPSASDLDDRCSLTHLQNQLYTVFRR